MNQEPHSADRERDDKEDDEIDANHEEEQEEEASGREDADVEISDMDGEQEQPAKLSLQVAAPRDTECHRLAMYTWLGYALPYWTKSAEECNIRCVPSSHDKDRRKRGISPLESYVQ